MLDRYEHTHALLRCPNTGQGELALMYHFLKIP